MNPIIPLLILLCAYSISSAQFPAQGLVANYPLDGTADDVSGNGFHGKTIRVRPTTDRFGNPVGALFFDGNSSFVRLGNILNTVFSAPDARFTVMGWAQTRSYPRYQGGGDIISKSAGGSDGPYQWSINHEVDGKLKWMVASSSNASDYVEIESDPIPTNRWFHFAAVFDGSQQASNRLRLYVDGVSGSYSRLVGVLGTSTQATDQEITLGAGHHADQPFSPNNCYSGAIDDIRIYDRVLGLAEIDSCIHERTWTSSPPPLPMIVVESPAFARAGETFWIEFNGSDFPASTELDKVGFDVTYTNTELVDFVSADASSSLLGPNLLYLATPDEARGRVSVGISRKETDEDMRGGQLLIRLRFRIAEHAPDNSSVTFILTNISASDNEGTSLRFTDRSSTTMTRAAARR